MATRLSFARKPRNEGIVGRMGGMGNVVVNAAMRTLTRKAVGKAIKSAKAAGGKKKKFGPKKKGSAKGK